EWGMLSPAVFIPHLEAANQIYKLDLYVLETVLEKMKTMEKSGFYIVPHSINLSRSDFDTCDIVEEVRRRVDAAGIRHDRITIEITESTIGSAFDFMKEQVLRFQSLGFPVWMDDFGSGYSSLDVLQSIKFDLLKFDMSFMKKLDEGISGKILLTELMKMATSLGMDTVCEGVETEDQVHFLQEIGCSKLQGYFYSKPIPFDALLERYCTGKQIGYENPAESTYFETIGRINLHDLTVIADENGQALNRDFNMLPAGVIEFKGNMTRFVRSNSAYREFLKRYFDFDLDYEGSEFVAYDVPFLNNMMTTCGEKGLSSLYDEQMKDGSTVHSFARRIGVNAVNGCTAVAVAVLSITPPNEGTTYANIARALAADYYNIYYVDLDTDRFIEYSSPVGKEVLALERHGDHFFDAVHRDVMTRIYEEDRELFLNAFSKEKIIKELEMHGVFAMTYRLIDSGSPIYASLKVTRVQGENKIILGVSIVEAQIRREEQTLQSQME
ncbi:MAG: EAL domain-containing protein, partial [Clostridia bacterium]|nr:EAL domain-containing protein [Clostridia bacterium]